MNYYSRKQQDLLGVYDVALPPNGAPQSFVNVGTMKNTGVEIELDWNAVKSKNLIIQLVLWALLQIINLVSFSNQFYEGPKYYWMSSFPLYQEIRGYCNVLKKENALVIFIHSSMRAWMIMEVG